MNFLKSYKRLDNLCKDLLRSETGVTTYISDMEQISRTNFQPINFDYKKLKHYRYIRNQIAHENYADETNMCNENDTLWIEQFHQRILDRTDPVSQYHKALARSQQTFKSKSAKECRSYKLKLECIIFLIVIAIIVSVILCYMGLWQPSFS